MQEKSEEKTLSSSRRNFLRNTAVLGVGASLVSLSSLHAEENTAEEKSKKNGSGHSTRFTILYTSDIHAQLHTHDEFFWENGKGFYKKRGGLAVLKTMINSYRKKNPDNTILIDGGDYF